MNLLEVIGQPPHNPVLTWRPNLTHGPPRDTSDQAVISGIGTPWFPEVGLARESQFLLQNGQNASPWPAGQVGGWS